MNTSSARKLLIPLALVGLATGACDFNLNGSITPHGTAVFDPGVDATHVTAGQALGITLTAENIFLVDPGANPPAEHADDAGHFQIYLDNFDHDPLVITAATQVTVTVPADTEPGEHKMACRIHKHDGTPTPVVIDVPFTCVAAAGEGEGEGAGQ